MKHSLLVILLVSVGLTAGIAQAANSTSINQFEVVELDQETDTSSVILPADDTGKLKFKNCAKCDTFNISMDSNSKFFVDKKQVDSASFREAMKTPHRFLMVHYHHVTHVVTRLAIS